MAEEHDLIAPLTEIIIGKSLSDAHLWGKPDCRSICR